MSAYVQPFDVTVRGMTYTVRPEDATVSDGTTVILVEVPDDLDWSEEGHPFEPGPGVDYAQAVDTAMENLGYEHYNDADQWYGGYAHFVPRH